MKEKVIAADGVTKKEEQHKGKEEIIIKYGFMALGIILVICIIAFAVISLLPKYALSVGDYKITEEEFEYHYFEQKNMVYQQIQVYYPDVSEAIFLQSEYSSGMTYHEFVKQLAMERIAEIYIMIDLAEKNSYVYDKIEMEDSKSNFKSSFEDYSTQLGLSFDEAANEIYNCDFDIVLKIYENTWLSSKYQDDLILEYEKEITENEVIEYYDNFKDDIDEVSIRQLFIATYDAETQTYIEDEEYEDAKTKAEAIFDRVKNGEDFSLLIEELSEDPSVEETKGEYVFRKSEIGLTVLAEWAFSADESSFDLIETEIGFHIVEFISRSGYDDAIDTVKSNIAYGKMLNLLTEKTQLPEYEIGYYDAFKKF